uniref:Sushi domain-containing protein n=1 Tax=Ciona savignyi TaxID=51511 RepID=H2Y871_CIOSA
MGWCQSANPLVAHGWPPGALAEYYCEERFTLKPNVETRTCRRGSWTGITPTCAPRMCAPPPAISQGSYSPMLHEYSEGSRVVYACVDGFQPLGHTTIVCMANLLWSTSPPSCYSAATTAVEVMDCSQPPGIDNGEIFCCLPNAEVTGVCCPVGGSLQFACNGGFTLQGGLPEWTCNVMGGWNEGLSSYPTSGKPLYPQCISDVTSVATPRDDTGGYNDNMMHTVLGVAVGVLCLLLLVVVLAFCRPKIRSMKRRWRDIREDENGLIVNGQRVTLPSYEQATTSDITWTEPTTMLNSLSQPHSHTLDHNTPHTITQHTDIQHTSTSNTDILHHNISTDILLTNTSNTNIPHTNTPNTDILLTNTSNTDTLHTHTLEENTELTIGFDDPHREATQDVSTEPLLS